MKRRLFTILSTLSLLLFVAVVSSWCAALVQSMGRGAPRWAQPYAAWRDGPSHGHAVMMTRGGLSIEARSLPWPPRTWPSRSIYDPDPDGALENADGMLVRMHRNRDGSLLGFQRGHWVAVVGNGFTSGPVRGDYLSVPVWFLMMASGALPLAWAAGAARARRRNRVGRCRRCGYDLRATPDRCPECGAVPDSAGVEKVGR